MPLAPAHDFCKSTPIVYESHVPEAKPCNNHYPYTGGGERVHPARTGIINASESAQVRFAWSDFSVTLGARSMPDGAVADVPSGSYLESSGMSLFVPQAPRRCR